MFPARAVAQELTCSPASLRYGEVVTGQSETLLIALTNTGKTSVTVSSVLISNKVFKVPNFKLPQVLTAGATLEVNVAFTPSDVGSASGQLTFVSNASDHNLVVDVGGAGVTSESVVGSPASLVFDDVSVGGSSTLPVVLTNTRTYAVTLTAQQTTGSAFSVSGAQFPLTLEGGKKVSLNVTFKPAVQGLTGGSSFFDGPNLDIPLLGTGTGTAKRELTVTPATLNFENVAVGGTATLAASLSATGGSVTISSASSSSSQFAVRDANFPLTVPAGQEVSLNVTFTPQHSVKSSGTLTFISNAADSPTSEALTGTGTAPYVSLSWNASSSPDVSGYNVYRKTSANSTYTKINSKLDPNTSYTDATVDGGTTYYYATSAVNSSGKESGYSNRAQVSVP
jgi:Abnormal spindle-like microcephaly-assoc'd, ASPM-SPD-2-Hydin